MTAKNHIITIRLNKEEKKILSEKAKKCGLKISTYLRFIGLRTSIREIKGKV